MQGANVFQDIDDYSYSKEVQCINNEQLPTCGTYVSSYESVRTYSASLP